MIKKKIGVFLMMIVMIGSIIGPITPINAAEIVVQGMCGENIAWTLYDDGLLDISGSGEMENYDMHDVHAPWYEIRDSITKIVVTGEITNIGGYTFFRCENVVSVEIPESVTIIGEGAFRLTSNLEYIDLPKGLTEIGEFAFEQSGIKEITIPENVNRLEDYLFCWSEKIEKVTVLSKKIEYIGRMAFDSCNNLQEVNFAGEVEYVGENAFEACYNLESFGNLTAMKKIGPWAFHSCRFKDFSMFKEVEEVGDCAFLEAFDPEEANWELVLPTTIKKIGGSAFDDADIHRIVISEAIEELDSRAFTDICIVVLVATTDVVISDDGYQFSGREKMEVYPFYGNPLIYEVRVSGEVSVTNNKSSYSVKVGNVTIPAGQTVLFNPAEEATSLEVVEGSYDSEWYKGKKYDYTGLKIIAHYEDGSSKELDSGFIVSDVDVSEVGDKTITVTYGSTSTTYKINVIEIPEEETVTIFKSVDIVVDENFKYKDVYFIPKADGIYEFYTTGKQDTKGTLMYSTGKVLATNDDGETINYRIESALKKGNLYIIRTELYLANAENPNVTIVADLVKVSEECWVCDRELIEEAKATCTQRAYSKYACTICKKESVSSWGEPLGHDFSVLYEDHKVTCTSDGYTTYMCKNCELKKVVNRVSKTGHQYVDTVVAPTVKEYGYTLHSCQRCKYNYKTAWVESIGTENELVYEENGHISSNDNELKTYSLEKSTIKKPKVKARRDGKKVKLTLSSREDNVKYQIYVKKNKKYKRIKTTKKNRITFKCKKKSYIRIRIIKNTKDGKVYSKYTKIRI